MRLQALLALACLVGGTGGPSASADVLARLKSTFKPSQEQALESALSAQGLAINFRYSLVSGLVRVSIPSGTPFETAKAKLIATGYVQYVEKDFPRRGAAISHSLRQEAQAPEIPDPTPQPTQWRDDPQQSLQYGVDQNGASEVWRTKGAIGNLATVIAVLDSGIDYTHPDLVANLWRDPANPGSIGYDFVNDRPKPWDDDGHGTHVAGIAAAVGGNGIGISGQCPRCSIMGLKIFDSSGAARDSDIIRALEFAVSKGAQVFLLAWGGPDDSQALKDALKAVSDAGRIIIVASGNDGADLQFAPYYPAKYRYPGMLTVAGLYNSPPSMPFWTNYGATFVQLSSGGADVYSTYPGGGFVLLSGTSMAAAQIAGGAALIKSYRPNLKSTEITDRLKTVTTDPDSASRTSYGGRPDLVRIFSKL